MLNFFKLLFGESKEKKESNLLPDLVSELIDISNGMGEYSSFDMTEEEKDFKGKEMLLRIKGIELKGKKFNNDELYYLLGVSYRNYTAWYIRGDERKKYLTKSLSMFEKVSKRHSEGRAEMGKLLIDEKLIRDLPRGMKILEELDNKKKLPAPLNSILAKANRQYGNIKVEENYSLCKFKNDPSPAVFREERKRFRALIRQYKKDKQTEELKKVLNNYYSLGILVIFCYGNHDCNSAVSGIDYDEAIRTVQENCNKINDSYEKSGQLKNSKFISNNDWKIFDKVFTI